MGLSRVFSNITLVKHQFFSVQLSLWSNSHPYMATGKATALTRWTFVSKVIALLFNTVWVCYSYFSKEQASLISWLRFIVRIDLEPKKMKSDTVSTFSPSICHEVMGPDAMILVF